MYLIALCDDETAELIKTEKLLRGYEKKHPGVDLVIEHFADADELVCMIREENYEPDVIFMDIFMPDRKGNKASFGMDAANELRSMEYGGKLVFLTTSREYALEAFDVDADQYLVKPVSENKLFSLMDRLLADVEEERRKYILLKIEGRLVKVPVNDIVYCEAQGKTQWLYLANGTQCLLRMSMAEIYELLSHYQEFVRIGVAFIVNLGYIGSLNAKEIHMDNGKKIYLPRGAYKGLREQYFNYYCREG
ncbi:MAG: LytTR family DNA-binding domain-containing protein [Eubacterium sp.]|nr:LytTR family DNA-binding domain-containing protein [Eubacterium sp.]MCM1214289.1 LytTR family DNA-binding domain-containing protein [Lachnospiraceae bacterium]MCM1302561.1 LytTR family DNA-binding domain-containing protein [Butyrivibrio sp.]MCM1342310.1 LytTR family DNA-binding domain-containing protein [Muribaculaceae bacterium]MCM1238053.1 LytTR family DNA-binding domain-containing protein [Lachnospiraceae bacterium]